MRYLQALLVLGCLAVGFSTGKAGKQDRQNSDAETKDSYGWVIGARQSHMIPMAPGAMDRVTIIWDQESIDRRLAHPHSPVTKKIVDWHKRHLHTALSLVGELYKPWVKNMLTVKVTPYYSGLKNAFFDPRDNSLTFGLFKDTDGWKAMCQSLDIVLHEGGHSLRHHSRPDLSRVDEIHLGALDETFGDLTTYFVREVYGIDPYSAQIASCIGGDIGLCIREMRHSMKITGYQESLESCEVHSLSQPFTGALLGAYESVLSLKSINPVKVARQMVNVYATAFFTLDKRAAHFEGVTLKIMKSAESFPTLSRVLGESFLKRGFLAIGPRQGIYVPDQVKTLCQKKGVSQTHERRATPKKKATQTKKKYVLVR